VGLKRLIEVFEEEPTQIPVVDQERPTLIVGLLDEKVTQGDHQPRSALAVGFQIGIEERHLSVLTGAVYQDDLGR
jgi:hypothetical protein